MELSYNSVQEWRKARKKEETITTGNRCSTVSNDRKWCPPPQSVLKVNVDTSIIPQSDTFSIGMWIQKNPLHSKANIRKD